MSEFLYVSEMPPNPGDKGLMRCNSVLHGEVDIPVEVIFNPYVTGSVLCWHYFSPFEKEREFWRDIWPTDVWRKDS